MGATEGAEMRNEDTSEGILRPKAADEEADRENECSNSETERDDDPVQEEKRGDLGNWNRADEEQEEHAIAAEATSGWHSRDTEEQMSDKAAADLEDQDFPAALRSSARIAIALNGSANM